MMLLLRSLIAVGAAMPIAVSSQALPSLTVDRVVAVVGSGKFQRNGWTSYVPIQFGTPLRAGDLVRVEPGSEIAVLCTDLTLHKIGSMPVSGVPCAAPPQGLSWDGSRIRITRMSATDLIPYIVMPRKTKLFDAHPKIRWNAVPGATQYAISIEPGSIWSATVSDVSEIVYPEDAPALVPGRTYGIRVLVTKPFEMRRVTSDDEGLPDLGFSVVGPSEARELSKAIERVQTLHLDDDANRLTIANLYAAFGIFAEAIEILESLPSNKRTAIAIELLGDLYSQVGLLRRAARSYRVALRTAGVEGSTQVLATVAEKLGKLDEVSGEVANARSEYRDSLAAYEKLGSAEDIQRLRLVVAGQSK